MIVTCGTDEKCARALELGADAAINYRDAGLRRGGARALTDGTGVDVVLDMVGGDYVPRNLQAWPTTAGTSRSPSSAAPRPKSRSPTSCGGG